MKKDKKVISILLCTFILLGIVYFLKSYLSGDFSEVKYGDIIKSGRYLYFTYYNVVEGEIANGTLVKVSKDGKKVLPLKNAKASNLSIYKGKLYYLDNNGQGENLCRINIDGNNYELIDTIGFGDYYINKERIYYLNLGTNAKGTGIYSCNLDLKDRKNILNGIDSFKIYKDKIYTGSSLSDNITIVNEWDLNGKFIRKIGRIENFYYIIEDGQLFFYPLKMVKLGEHKYIGTGCGVYSINIKTGEKKEIVKDTVGFFRINEEKIYYDVVDINPNVSEDDPYKYVYTPYVCNLDGKEKKKQNELTSLIGVTYCIDGKSLYYLDEKQNLLIRSIKGGKAKIIVPSIKLKNIKAGQLYGLGVKYKISGYIIRYGKIYYSIIKNDQSKPMDYGINYSCNLKGYEKQKDESF